MRKKIIFVLMVITMMFSLVSCKNEEKEVVETEEESTKEDTEKIQNEETENSYNLKDGSKVLISANESDELSILVATDNEEKATLAFATYYSSLSALSEKTENVHISIGIYCNEKFFIYSALNGEEVMTGTNSDGSTTNSLPDWIETDVSSFMISEEEQQNFVNELTECAKDFAESE